MSIPSSLDSSNTARFVLNCLKALQSIAQNYCNTTLTEIIAQLPCENIPKSGATADSDESAFFNEMPNMLTSLLQISFKDNGTQDEFLTMFKALSKTFKSQ